MLNFRKVHGVIIYAGAALLGNGAISPCVRRSAGGHCTRRREDAGEAGGRRRRARSCVGDVGSSGAPAPLLRLDRYSTSYSTRELLGVHPSSLVGENASIAPGVRVGPFCVVSDDATIGPNCELGAGVHILGHTTLGPDCVIRSHAVVGSDGPGTTTLGRGNVVGAHAVVGAACQDKKSSPKDASHLRVGDNNDIREHAQLHRSSGPSRETIIGDGNLVMRWRARAKTIAPRRRRRRHLQRRPPSGTRHHRRRRRRWRRGGHPAARHRRRALSSPAARASTETFRRACERAATARDCEGSTSSG